MPLFSPSNAIAPFGHNVVNELAVTLDMDYVVLTRLT